MWDLEYPGRIYFGGKEQHMADISREEDGSGAKITTHFKLLFEVNPLTRKWAEGILSPALSSFSYIRCSFALF